jgi:hypothetical protein
LRLNNPLGATVTFSVPTTGYDDIVVMYETRRSGQGAGTQVISYTTNGTSFEAFGTIATFNAPPVLHTLHFSAIPAANDNPNFAIRIAFEQGDGGIEGNNRFDNFTVEGRSLAANPNHPPFVENPIPLQELIENSGPFQIDLNYVFSDPDGDTLTYTAASDRTDVATVSVSANWLSVAPGSRGAATVTVTAGDGANPPVPAAFLVLVYPAAHPLAGGNFAFLEWESDRPEGAFPEHMIFLQSDSTDTAIDTPLFHAYHVPHDDYASADLETVGFPYNNTARTRINGLGEHGISFINTGRGRDLGGALLALDTRGVTDAPVEWLGGTVTPNERVYAIRLHYRVGLDGPFLDLPGAVEYVRNENAGHTQPMGPVSLPAGANTCSFCGAITGSRATPARARNCASTTSRSPAARLRRRPSFSRGSMATGRKISTGPARLIRTPPARPRASTLPPAATAT